MEVQDVNQLQLVQIQSHIRRLASVKLCQQYRDKREKRNFLIGQLFHTESNYLAKLQLVIERFLTPLEESLKTDSPILPAEVVVSLFSCIREIVALAVRLGDKIAALKTVENCKFKMSTLFGAELLSAMFDPYKRYCSNYNIVHGLVLDLKRDNARFTAFLKDAEKRCGREDLESNLIRIVQRVPQYVISFEDILKCTPNVDPDYSDFAEAIESMKSLGKSIDEFVGQMEQMRCWKKMESLFGDSLAGFREIELIPNREQLWNCDVHELKEQKFRVKESKPEIFVFSDVLVLTKAPRLQDGSPQASRLYEIEKINFFLTSVFTENILLVDNEDERTATISALEPIGGNPNRIWKLKFATLESLHKFVDVFDKASRKMLKNSNSRSGGSTPLSPDSTSSEKSNDKSNESPSSRDRKQFKKKERKLSNALPNKGRFLSSEWENPSRSSEEPASGSEDLHHSASPHAHPLHHGIGEKKAKEREEKRQQRGHRSSSLGEAPLYHSNPQLAQSLLPCAMRSHLMPQPVPSHAPRRPSTSAPVHAYHTAPVGLTLTGSGGSSPGNAATSREEGAKTDDERESEKKELPAPRLVSQDGPLRGVESEPIFARTHVKCDVFTIYLDDSKKSIVKEANHTLEETLAKICLARGWALERLVVKDASGNALDMHLTMDRISVPSCYITLKTT